ncbi:APO protein 2, chloroplastic [Tanacetum coccineum]
MMVVSDISVCGDGVDGSDMSCNLISPELGSTSFLCKQTFLSPKIGILRYNSQQDLQFLDSLKFGGKKSRHQQISRVSSPNLCRTCSLVINCSDNPQNVDLPRYFSKKEKKPFPIPIVELRRAARERMKSSKGQPKRSAPPPKNGLLVQRMIPLAYAVLNARTSLINNLNKLIKVVPVQACKWSKVASDCNEILSDLWAIPSYHVKPNSSIRNGKHEWVDAMVEDIFIQIEAFHLYDRLGKRIPHEERFSVPRLPALIELCIQAGVDLPDFPTKRRRKPIIRISKSEFIDADEKETLQSWEKMRSGANRLMKMYPVRVCGYCPEIHVGPTGHKAQNCGAFKHQQRNGQHGWQTAVLDDLIPPRYVWHVPNLQEPMLQKELRNFYGQAPAVVEICVQAGAAVPEQYKPTMRLDVGIPSSVREAEMVV